MGKEILKFFDNTNYIIIGILALVVILLLVVVMVLIFKKPNTSKKKIKNEKNINISNEVSKKINVTQSENETEKFETEKLSTETTTEKFSTEKLSKGATGEENSTELLSTPDASDSGETELLSNTVSAPAPIVIVKQEITYIHTEEII